MQAIVTQLDGVSEKLINLVSSIDIPIVKQVSDQFESAARSFLVDTAGQGKLVAQLDVALTQGVFCACSRRLLLSLLIGDFCLLYC
jgi:hypothetical protein